MNIKSVEEAGEIIKNFSDGSYDHWEAKGFLKGHAAGRNEMLEEFDKIFEKIKWILYVAFEREGSSEAKARLLGIVEDAQLKIKNNRLNKEAMKENP